MVLTPWVSRLIFLNVAVFLPRLFLHERYEAIEAWGALIPIPELLLYRPWTLVTYMFLHASFGHIFFNMLSLMVFGPRVELELGGRSFFLLYFVSGISGGLLSLAFPSTASIVGASGATFGVMLAYAKFWPRDQILIWFVPMQVRIAVIVMTVITLFGSFGIGSGNIAHLAHLGGFAGAFFYLRLLDSRSRKRRFEVKQKGPRVSRSDLDRWSKIRRDELHEVNREELDRIMEKIEREGVGSVTPQERSFLDNFSERAGS